MSANARKTAEKSRKGGSQNRDFVRLDVLLPVYFNVLSDPAQRMHLSPPNLGSSINLSAGGMLLATDRELAAATRLLVTFTLFQGEPEVFTEAEVLFTERQQDGALRKYLSHLAFLYKDKEVQDKVTRFIFDRQRNLKRQGLLS